MTDVSNLELAARIGAAVLLGAVVGLERELRAQPAGLRTNITVALGACVFGLISVAGFLGVDGPRDDTTLQADVTRVASNVVVGVGFLGAGLIFRSGDTVKNLTTAGTVWAVAAIGLASGVGRIDLAAMATAALVASLVVLRPIRRSVRGRWADPEDARHPDG